MFFSWAPSSENTQKALRSLRMIYFFKGKLLSFCFSPFTLVFQLYLPPLAEICLCVGQTVFSPLSLFYASTLLLDPQWQWRGTLVFNLLSHSQIDPHNNYFKNCWWVRKSTVQLASIVKWTCSSIQSWQRRPIMEMQQKTVPASDQWVSLFPCKDSAGASNMPLRSIAGTMSCWQQNLYKNSSSLLWPRVLALCF